MESIELEVSQRKVKSRHVWIALKDEKLVEAEALPELIMSVVTKLIMVLRMDSPRLWKGCLI